MGKEARNYSQTTLKRLYALSRNQCAFPGCKKRLVNQDNALYSNICHIEAANENGKRYNPNMTDEERNNYPNLILLCLQHHREIDNSEKYTVKVLKEMKRDHESEQLIDQLTRNPSMLINAINAIASLNIDDIDTDSNLDVFDPMAKIEYNDLKENVPIIQEYKAYYQRINDLYDELESEGSIKKERLLHNIKTIYLKVLGKYVGGLQSDQKVELIRKNSDNIFNDIYDELLEKMENSSHWEEDLIFSIYLIMVDAFLRCKILEEPK